ncbi:zinc-dependent metalloprotease [Changchengzhania lutea]|uniref:zinc-dependent metalloprotease n=1 Tax=Changchengzhania lutea TaxID=2049305 RepID=UPI00163DBDA1|nr:GEVED domain-containing protein [Changchengzhania lutea]
MKAKLHHVLLLAIVLMTSSAISQNNLWKEVNSTKDAKVIEKLNINSKKAHVFELNTALFKNELSKAPLRNKLSEKSPPIVNVPGLNGQIESFKIYETPVFSPSLSAKFPEIKSYIGISATNSGARLRMSMSPQGLQTMITYSDRPTVFMQPVVKERNNYVLYNREEKISTKSFKCLTENELNSNFNKNATSSKIDEGGANDQTLQKFRIAISVTGEYTVYHGGTVMGALSAINASLNRVNEIFETDMAVRFELVDALDIIYTDASTDPYSPASTGVDGAWSNEIQSTLTTAIGEAAYDIGHLFGATGGGGNAGCIGCVCTDGSKGSAFTSPADGVPEGDTFDLNFVAHEIGHQMGANHTWAFESEGFGVNSEPGNGSTVMAYAGLELNSPNNVALNSDDYFHYHSIKQILDNLSTKNCQTTEAITNNPPIANAGSNYNIPASTPYILKGFATDANGGDNLTYCWEQIDSGKTDYLNFGPNLSSGSINRSLPPTSSPDRYIPRFSSVLEGSITQTNPTLGSDWETASSVARDLNWALTVRDRTPILPTGGQSSYDRMRITVENVAPFTVSNPVSWPQGSTQTIEWEVGQTTNGTINCQNVNIRLSTDSGITFPTTIANNTPNDGSFMYTVPSISNTSKARLLIEAADNIFYDVSDFDFSISPNPDFFMVDAVLDPISCQGTTATYNFDYVASNGFSENTVFSLSGNPGSSTVTFLPSNLNSSGNVTIVISDLGSVAQGDYPLVLTGTAMSRVKNETINFPFFNQVCNSEGNTDYATSTTLVQFNTINNASGKPSGYSDYRSTSTDVNRNSSYNLTVNVNTAGAFTTNTVAWIDWNKNCSFDNVDELYDLGFATNVTNGPTSNSPLSITIPADAVLDNIVMRISTKWDGEGVPISCESGFDGEVEDYALTVLSSNLSYDTSITLVKFNTINQVSEKPSEYSNYTSIPTEVSRDEEYDLTVNVSTERDFTTATKAWIDWNQNNNFTDPGEEYNLGEATNVNNNPSSNSPFTIYIPIDAVLGKTTMRIATKYNGDFQNQELLPTENGLEAEVEDYSLYILPTKSIEANGFENLLVFPNPNNGQFTIKLNGSLTRAITLEVFDIRGHFIGNIKLNGTGDLKEQVDFYNLSSGVYVLKISDGTKSAIKKMVVK